MRCLRKIFSGLLLTGVAFMNARGQVVLKAYSFSGGSGVLQSSSYNLRASMGQIDVGQASSASFSLNSGFDAGVSGVSPQLADLVFTASDVNPATVAPGGKLTFAFTVKNIGNLPVSGDIIVKAYLSDNTVLNTTDDILLTPSFNLGNELPANGEIVFPVNTSQVNQMTIPQGTTEKSWQLLIVLDPDGAIPESKEENNIVTKAITVSTAADPAVDSQPPVFGALTKPSALIDGVQMSIVVTDNLSGVSEVKFHHRPIRSKEAYAPETLTASGGSYSISVLASWGDELGMEGYFTAKDVAGNSSRTDQNIIISKPIQDSQTIPGLLAGGKPESYTIFSIPFDVADNNTSEIFKSLGDYDKTKWRLVRYEGGRNVDRKEGLTKIEPGKGYWFNSVEKVDIKIGAGKTVAANQDSPFSLALEKGWTQIGNPYPFDISWADVLSFNPTKASKVDQQILIYNASTVSLKESTTLKTWSGGFVFSTEALSLSLPVTAANGSRIAPNTIDARDPDGDEWLLPLTLSQGTLENDLPGIGMHPEANSSKDTYDKLSPPRFIRFLELTTNHPEFFQPEFARDIVPTSRSFTWSFTLSADEDSPVTLSWDNSSLVGAQSQLMLFEETTSTLLDMRSTDHFEIRRPMSTKIKFFYGRTLEDLKPDITAVGTAYPNPFSEKTTIPYVVGEKRTVQIGIYNSLGSLVKVVVDGEHEPGVYTATWDRTDNSYITVSSGMYFYRETGSGKTYRVVVK